MPGATVDSVDGDEIKGRIKVKVGPVALTYAGTARFTDQDEQARKVVLEASGKETRGSGTASATITSTLSDEAGQTRVVVHTTMTVTGRPAQFGRGVMAEVSGRVIEKFATNLAAQLSGGAAAPAASARGGRQQPRGRPGPRSGRSADRGPEPPGTVVQQPAPRGGGYGRFADRAQRAGPAGHRRPRPGLGQGDPAAASRPGPQPGHGGRGQRWHQRHPGQRGRGGQARPARPPRPRGPARWPAGWPTRIWPPPTACCRRRAPGRQTRTRSTC